MSVLAAAFFSGPSFTACTTFGSRKPTFFSSRSTCIWSIFSSLITSATCRRISGPRALRSSMCWRKMSSGFSTPRSIQPNIERKTALILAHIEESLPSIGAASVQ